MKKLPIRFPLAGATLKILLFFYVLFCTNRLLFLGYFHERYTGYTSREIIFSFFYGLQYDSLMSMVLLIIPLIIITLQYLFDFRLIRYFLYTYLVIILCVNCFCLAFDVGIYDLSQIHLNFRILNYIRFLSHGIQFSDPKLNAVYYSMLFVQVIFGIWLLWILFKKNGPSIIQRKPSYVLSALLSGILLFGYYYSCNSPRFNINQTFDPDSENLRDLSTNVLFNVGYKYIEGEAAKRVSPYHFMLDKEAATIVNDRIFQKKDSMIDLFDTKRPNIVLFMLESFTADVIEPLGGDSGVTPNLGAIIKDGLLFSKIYSPGYRTDQGLASILNGFPAVPDFSIEMDTEKSKKLPFVTNTLINAGYQTSLYYGGDLDFANMQTYFGETGIKNLNDSHSFPKQADDPKWGIHDERVFLKQAREAGSSHAPFFSMIISLSSHEPFLLPVVPKFAGSDLATKFKNCCFYTDQSIGKYMDSVKNKDWYKNTLFVFMADHGHNFPRNRRLNEEARFHIPMVFYGEPLKREFRGTSINQLGMQSDFAATLLSQLKLPHHQFRWSSDLMNFYRNPFAYYCFDSGLGWMEKDANMKIDFSSGLSKVYSGDADRSNKAKAYLQVLFDEYLHY